MNVVELIDSLQTVLKEQPELIVAGVSPEPVSASGGSLHSHSNWELLLCTERVRLNPPGAMHGNSSDIRFSFAFDICRLSCSLRAKKIFYRWRIPGKLLQYHLAPELFSMMLRVFPAQPLSGELFRAGVTSLIHLLQKIDASPHDASYSGLARLLIDYLHQHYYQNTLSSDEIGEAFGMSPQYLNRALNAEGFLSIRASLSRIRLEKAAELLKSGEYSVSDVAHLTGWQSPFYFSNCFRRHFGIAPSTYQQNHLIRPFRRARLD